MKQLNEFVKEGLFDNIDKLDGVKGLDTTVDNLKNEITDWLMNNYLRTSGATLTKSQIKIDITTTPPTVNYNGGVTASSRLTSLNNNGMFQWGKVKGSFSCSNLSELTSLEGAPKEVWGEFKCDFCRSLKSLEGAPEKVGGSFYCSRCKSLKSLEGCPKAVGGFFSCSECSSLKSVDLTGFDTSNVTNMNDMFYNCSLLKNIYVTSGKWSTSKATTTNMFLYCGTSSVTYK